MNKTDRFYLYLLLLCIGYLLRAQLLFDADKPTPLAPAPTPQEWYAMKLERCAVYQGYTF